MSEELLPCPKCGAAWARRVMHTGRKWVRYCGECGEVFGAYETEAEALAAWDRRASPALAEAAKVAVKHLVNAKKRVTVHPDELGNARQLQINCDKANAHIEAALTQLRTALGDVS